MELASTFNPQTETKDVLRCSLIATTPRNPVPPKHPVRHVTDITRVGEPTILQLVLVEEGAAVIQAGGAVVGDGVCFGDVDVGGGARRGRGGIGWR